MTEARTLFSLGISSTVFPASMVLPFFPQVRGAARVLSGLVEEAWAPPRWEEKVAAVAQSARISATRDGLAVGNRSGLLAKLWVKELINAPSPDPRTQCVDGRRLSGRPRSRPTPLPGSLPSSSPPPQRSQPRGRRPRLALNFSALGSGSWTRGLPAHLFPRFHLRASFWTKSEQTLSGSLLSLQPFRGGDSPRSGSCLGSPAPVSSISPSPGYNFQAKLPQDDHTGGAVPRVGQAQGRTTRAAGSAGGKERASSAAPDRGSRPGLLHPSRGLHGLLRRVQEPIPGVPAYPEGTVRARSPLDFLWVNEASFFHCNSCWSLA